MAGGTRRGRPVASTATTPQNDEDLPATPDGEGDDIDLIDTERKEDEPKGQSDDDEDQLQRLLQREQELRRKLEMREVQRRIRELEASLESDDGSAPVNHRTRDASVSSKRGVPDRTSSESDDGGDPSQRRPPTLRAPTLRIKAPPEYRGKNIKEHKDFIRACELVFRESPVVYRSDSAKVLMALPYLKGDPADA